MEESSNTLGDSQQERKCSIGLETKNAGIARDEGPIRADDVNERMFCYFAVPLAIRRFSNVLKESRYRAGASKKTVSRFIRHPIGLLSRLNTDELLLAASASCKF